MSQKHGILNLSIPTARTQNMVPGKLSILVIGLSVVALVALIVFAAVPAVTNPELMDADHGADVTVKMVDTSFLTANPELRIFELHAAEVAKQAATQFLASNPEIRVLQRHAAAQAKAVASATAPLFRLYDAEMTQQAEAQFLASNPEVRILRRYAAQNTGQ
jgi:hypothetical protein